MSQEGSGAKKGDTGQQEDFRVVIVGDKACGKTALLTIHTKGVFLGERNKKSHIYGHKTVF